MSWFNFYWAPEDYRLLAQWRNHIGKNCRFIDENVPDPQADEIPYPFIPRLIDDGEDLTPIIKNKINKRRVPLTKYQKLEVFTLKGKQCDICGNMRTLEIHHIDSDPTNNMIDNLQVVCHECHQKISRKQEKKLYISYNQ